MGQYAELKRTAQIAQRHSQAGNAGASNPYIFDFLAEATPDLILTLIADNERLTEDCQSMLENVGDLA